MKYLNIISAAAIFMAACSPGGPKTENKDGAQPTDTTLVKNNANATDTSRCFLLTEGKNNKDTTTIELAIKNKKVTGQMIWLPYEKDKRTGTLEGVIKDDSIHAVWSFMQEGMRDSIPLKFLLKGNLLVQKPLKFDEKTGKQQTDEKAGYTLAYKETGKIKK
ncbi:MAG: hypothetical protein V4577_03025 [Bacteroidota bacterium]